MDDIFAPATAVVSTSKFKPKPRIINKKTLPKPSKSGTAEGPSSSSKFPDAADSELPVEGSSGLSSGFPFPFVPSTAHPVQNFEGTIEYSISNNVLDRVSQLGVGEPKQCTDISCCLASLDGDNRSFSVSGTFSVEGSVGIKSGFLTSSITPHARDVQEPERGAEYPICNDVLDEGMDMTCHLESLVGDIQTSSMLETVGVCKAISISRFETKESKETVNPALGGDDSVDILTHGVSSLVERSVSELHSTVRPFIAPVEVAQNEVNASLIFTNMQNAEETPTLSNVDSLDESLFEVDASAERMKGKFRPKPCKKSVRCILASSASTRTAASEAIKTSESPSVPETKSQENLNVSTLIMGTCNSEVSDWQKSSDQFASLEMLDSDIKQTSTTGDTRPISTSNLYSNNSEPFSVSLELDVTQSSLIIEGSTANVGASHLSERLSNLPTEEHSSVEPLDYLFLQSDQPAVTVLGKFRPKPSLRVKDGKKTKSVSFILPNIDGESPGFFDCQSELVTSNPIERITSIVEMSSDENIDESLGSSSMCKRDNEVNLDVINISALDTPDVLFEPICSSEELADKFQTDLHYRTESVEAISGNSPGLIDYVSSDMDPLHIQSAATCSAPISQVDNASGYSNLDSLPINRESLDAHGPRILADDLIESLSMKVPNYFFTSSSEERAYGDSNKDLPDQSLVEHEYLYNMEGEHIIVHSKEANIEEYAPSIAQNDESGKSSRRVGLRKRKSKSSVIDNMVSEDQNSKDTISVMDEDYGGDGYRAEDMVEKKKMKATKKSSSRSSENGRSIKSTKKVLGKPDSTVKDPPKKRLPHGSRCKSTKRRVNKTLLEIPDDELDRRQLAIRDLIRLAGFKERISASNKEATALKSIFSNQSEEHEQSPDDDDANRDIQGECPKFNYHSYMRRPQKTRWSSTETELFYQAVRQFGTDFAMIQVLFPSRSREQVKAKFKNEQRKHPLQIDDAIFYRTKDHSHFEKVIQCLQVAAEQTSKNDSSEPSIKSQDETY